MSWTPLYPYGLKSIPGIPTVTYGEMVTTIKLLVNRKSEAAPAVNGLSDHNYVINGDEYPGQDFLYGVPAQDLTKLSLDKPQQFAIGWTTYQNVYNDAVKDLEYFASLLTDADAATKGFWPMIAKYGAAFNLLMLCRVTNARWAEISQSWGGPLESFGGEEQAGPHGFLAKMNELHADGRLYELDFSLLESLQPFSEGGKPVRFNPATLTLLKRTDKGVLEPVVIRVWTKNGGNPVEYYRDDAGRNPGAWLYALQAAKTSVTLYGIWLGHVYHWHLVTAAMQATMFAYIPTNHPLYYFLAPQSSYLMAFDYVLMGGFNLAPNIFADIAPPSSVGDVTILQTLANQFAAGRNFFDDDPKTELANQGINQADFTKDKPWDCYPAVQQLLQVWENCETLVTTVVNALYSSDSEVAQDASLQNWMTQSGSWDQSNIRGLPTIESRPTLIKLLTSLVYRVTAHGISRLVHTANPALTFVGNFPPCLQRTDIPPADAKLSTQELLTYLPNTGTIGEMLNFYFAFSFSGPYVPLVPPPGGSADGNFPWYFPATVPGGDRCNAALQVFFAAMTKFMGPENISQWPRNIET